MSTQVLRPRSARARGVRFLNPLYRSGYALAANTVGTTAIGVAFWAAAAHLYDRQTVGRSSALISMLFLVANISQLNMVNTLARFLPRINRSAGRFIIYSYAASSGTALAAALICVTVLPKVNSQWQFVGRSLPLAAGFVAAAVVWVVFALEDAALTGLRRATVVPFENMIYGILKLLVLVGVAWSLRFAGIFVAWTIPLVVIVPVINWLIFRRYLQNRGPVVPAGRLRPRDILRFTSVDYLGSLIGQAYGSLLPLIVLSTLGAGATGSFYIAWTISNGLILLAGNFGTSLLVEGTSAPHRLAELTRGVLARCMLIIGLAAAVLVTAPHLILGVLYGHEYAVQASSLLALLALGAIPRGLLQITFALDRIANRVGRAALTHLALAVLVLGGSWLLLGRFGIDGVGLAWAGSTLIVAIVRSPTIVSAARRPAVMRPGRTSAGGPRHEPGSGGHARQQGSGLHRRPAPGRHRASVHPAPRVNGHRPPEPPDPGVIEGRQRPPGSAKPVRSTSLRRHPVTTDSVQPQRETRPLLGPIGQASSIVNDPPS